MLRAGVLSSGRGSNFKAILDHIKLGVLKGLHVSVLIYSNEEARVAKIAKEYGVESILVKHRGVPRMDREAKMMDLLDSYGVDLVVLAGYNYILSSEFVERYRWRSVNIHPSLIPFAGGKGMYGKRVHIKVYSSGVKVTGPTIHFLDIAVDRGPIIDQIPVYIGDIYGMKLDFNEKIKAIENRVLIFEHRLYSRVLQMMVNGLVDVEEQEVSVHRVTEENGKIEFIEDKERRNYVILKFDKKWIIDWNNREKVYINFQKDEWREMGSPLEEVLGPW